MDELLRFTSKCTNGISAFLPPKIEFVFYDTKVDMYKKDKLIRTINYDDVSEIAVIKTWKTVLLINCKPIGINIYDLNEETIAKIREIIKK